MNKKYTEYIIVILLIMNLFAFFKMNSLERSLDNNQRQYENEINDLRNEINNIYYNVDSKLKKEASIIDDYNIQFGDKLNADNLTVPITLSVTPKEYSDDLKAYLLIGDEKVPMEKGADMDFITTYDASVFKGAKIKLALEKNGTEKIETLEEYSDLQFKYVLSINGGFNGNSNYDSKQHHLKGSIDINFMGPNNNQPVKISMVKELNGKIFNEQEIDISDLNKDTGDKREQPAREEYPEETMGTNFLSLPVDERVSMSSNDSITYYMLIEDKYGLNYKYVIFADKINENGKIVNARPEWTNGNIIEITDKNGNVLYKPDYIK